MELSMKLRFELGVRIGVVASVTVVPVYHSRDQLSSIVENVYLQRLPTSNAFSQRWRQRSQQDLLDTGEVIRRSAIKKIAKKIDQQEDVAKRALPEVIWNGTKDVHL